MNAYTKKLKQVLESDNQDDNYYKAINDFLPNLKMCVQKTDTENFNLLVNYFLDYGLNDIDPANGIYNSEIRQFLYDLIMNEKYEFIKDWDDRQYGEIANSIILEKMVQVFNDPKLNMMTKEDREELLDLFLNSFLMNCGFTLLGILSDEWFFNNIKDRIVAYVHYSELSLELMFGALSKINIGTRDYLPNRKYTREMFEFSDNLYNDRIKRLGKDEVILATLEKFGFPFDKLDSYRVRWGVYKNRLYQKRK